MTHFKDKKSHIIQETQKTDYNRSKNNIREINESKFNLNVKSHRGQALLNSTRVFV